MLYTSSSGKEKGLDFLHYLKCCLHRKDILLHLYLISACVLLIFACMTVYAYHTEMGSHINVDLTFLRFI
ncbi:hypothetical protein XELAEV_18013203mg [Xenopus laevis]|uniref:Uncharacterized protein n=1 Tax=Xenopus laevis TaxID=8355 RepID=A0A974DRP6_XENLA|nr:hypothetical protein XELAEV_18013203mg [Xenopus laevis]